MVLHPMWLRLVSKDVFGVSQWFCGAFGEKWFRNRQEFFDRCFLLIDDFETFTFGFSHSMTLYGFFPVGYKNIVYE